MAQNNEEHIIHYAQTVKQFTVDDYVHDMALPINTAEERHVIQQAFYRMVVKGKLQRVRHGVYVISSKNQWYVMLGEQEKAVYDLIHAQYPLVKLCVYNGETFAPLQHHLAFNQATYIEVERDSVENAFHQLQDAGYEVYCCPDEQMAYDYVDVKKKIVVVKALVSQAPLARQEGYYVPTLEKLLVDIRKDKDFYYMQGIEASYMTDTARQMYVINEQKLRRYAKRRNVAIIDNRL